MKDITTIEALQDFDKVVRSSDPDELNDSNSMVLPGTLEDKHKDFDPEKGIPPLRMHFNLIYLLLEGDHEAYMGAEYRKVNHHDLVIVPENLVYAAPVIRNCKGYCLLFKTEFLKTQSTGLFSDTFPFLDAEANRVLALHPEESDLMRETFLQINGEYKRVSVERDYILRHLIQVLLLRIREISRLHLRAVGSGTLSRSQQLANKFKVLVERNAASIRSVSQYADMLNISPKYLTDVVRQNLGRSPRDVINNTLLLETKVLLQSTDLTLSQIACDLGFEDQSHFTRFVRQHAGVTPLELRKSLT